MALCERHMKRLHKEMTQILSIESLRKRAKTCIACGVYPADSKSLCVGCAEYQNHLSVAP